MSEETRDPSNPHPGIDVIEIDIDKVHMVQGQLNLAPALRAQIALGTSKTEAALVELAAKHQSITEIKDKAGREQAHGAAMELMRTRTTIADLSKRARDDATKFSRAVIAEEQRLIGIIEPEEKRLKGLRDDWDAEQERIKREKAEAERKRLLAISEQITSLKAFGPLAAQCRTSARIQELIDRLTAVEVTPEIYAEFTDDAAAAKSVTLNQMGAAFKAKQEQEAEAARLAAERAEQERVRQEQAERQRQLEAQAAELERQRKELEAATAAAQAAAAPPPPPPVEPSTASNTSPVSESGIPAADAAILNATAQTLLTTPQGNETFVAVIHAEHDIAGELRGDGATAAGVPLIRGEVGVINSGFAIKPSRPTDDEIIDALALHFRVHESKVIEWLQDMDLEIASKHLAGEFA